MTDEPKDQSSIEELEKNMMGEMQHDDRLNSGSHTSTGDADLDFINMTGLVAPAVTEAPAATDESLTVDYEESDLDPEAPVSFYEEGVDDVDTSMDPANTSTLDDEEILGRIPSLDSPQPISPALEGLQEIITELTQDEGESVSYEENEQAVDPIEIEIVPDEAAGESIAEMDDLANINLEAASEALEDLDLSQDSPDADSADISNLISSIDFGEAESLLEELDSPAPDNQGAGERIEILETPEIEVFMESDTDLASNELAEAPLPNDHERIPITTIDLDNIPLNDTDELDTSVYSKPPLPKTAPRHKRRRSIGANVLQLLISVMFISVIVGLFYYTLDQYNTKTLTPQESYAIGITMINDGLYQEAGDHFTTFARSADTPLKQDAEFMAAYALVLTPQEPQTKALEAYNEALIKFDSFLENNPMHEKASRAETLSGILQYKIGDYPEAIKLLSDPKRRLRDSSGYLPALRTLARSYAALSDMENAHLTFMRVASLDDNIAPGKDYIELAGTYKILSSSTTDNIMQIHYGKQAIELWDKAIRLPGVLAVTKRELETLRDFTNDQLSEIELGGTTNTTPERPAEQDTSPEDQNTELDLDSLRLPDSTQ